MTKEELIKAITQSILLQPYISPESIEDTVRINVGIYEKGVKRKIDGIEDLNQSALASRVSHLEGFIETLKHEIDIYQTQIKHYMPDLYPHIKKEVKNLSYQRRIRLKEEIPAPIKNGATLNKNKKK